MPTLPPSSESPNAMQNRQVLDATSAVLSSLNLLRPGAVPSLRYPHGLLAPGTWPATSVSGPSILSLTGLAPNATILPALTLAATSEATEVRNLTIGDLIVRAGSKPILFTGTVHTGTILIEAGAQVAFLGVDFAGPATAINNAGLAADVLVSGAIKRNAVAHVNATVTGELVV